MNNNDIKNEIIALLQNQNTDITDPDIQDKINGLLLLSSYKKFNNIKGIGVRILSKNEYNKYIINGTCDGSTIANDKNVYNHIEKDYKVFVPTLMKNSDGYFNWINTGRADNSNISPKPSFIVSRSEAIGYEASPSVFDTISENFQDNKNNLMLTKCDVRAFICSVVSYGAWIYAGGEKQCINVNVEKSKPVYSTSFSVKADSGRNYYIQTCNINIYISFRPAFFYVDNNKSLNNFQ